MTPSHENQAEGSLQEELVAYLDGELDAQSCRRIEDLLARDESVRGELQSLARSWDALDHLPRCEVSPSFTHSTVEMVALAAEDDLQRQQDELPRRRRRLWLMAFVVAVAAAAVSFAGMVSIAPDRNEELARDLPLLENLDEYRQIDDFRFLRMLTDEGIFPGEPEPHDAR